MKQYIEKNRERFEQGKVSAGVVFASQNPVRKFVGPAQAGYGKMR